MLGHSEASHSQTFFELSLGEAASGVELIEQLSAYQCGCDRAGRCIPGVAGDIVYIGSRRTNDCFGERLF